MTDRLTALDLDIISRARDLADAGSIADLRRLTSAPPDAEPSTVRDYAFGGAQYLLGQLIAIIERD